MPYFDSHHSSIRSVRAITSFLYYLIWITGIAVIIGLPAFYYLGGERAAIEVPVTISDVKATVTSEWDPALREVSLREGVTNLRIPIRSVPSWFVGAQLIVIAGIMALGLAFVSKLRRLFLRVEEGVPFDPANVRRLRQMGVTVIAMHLVVRFAMFALAAMATEPITSSSIAFEPWFDVDLSVGFFALMLFALAEVFRYGAALEEERSLVV